VFLRKIQVGPEIGGVEKPLENSSEISAIFMGSLAEIVSIFHHWQANMANHQESSNK